MDPTKFIVLTKIISTPNKKDSMENLSRENTNENINSDAAIIEAIATIYSNWVSNEQKKNEIYISQILNKLQDATSQAATEERKAFVKEQFKRHAETLDPSCRTSIYGVFYILNEVIHGEKLKKWGKDFADSFLKTQDKNFLKKKDNYDLKKWFKNLMKMVSTEQKEIEENQRQQEANKDEEKKLAKAQKNKKKRERKKLEKVSQLLLLSLSKFFRKKNEKLETQEIQEEEEK